MIPILISILPDSLPPPNFNMRSTSTIAEAKAPMVIVNGLPFYGRIDTLNTDTVFFIPPGKVGPYSIYGNGGVKGLIMITTKNGKK